MPFTKLGLGPKIVRALSENNYTEPSPIQSMAIPVVASGKDLIASAQTGTGKTAAFALPLIDRIAKENDPIRRITVLILSPTRELASQIGANIDKYSKYLPIRTAIIYGGVDYRQQFKALKNGVQIVVATPGRLLDHVKQGTVDLRNVKTLVLDEGDRMMDMGFINDIRKIIKLLPERRQNLLFSATVSKEVQELAKTILRDFVVLKSSEESKPVEGIEQVVHPVDNRKRRELLSHLISEQRDQQVLVFTRTKHGADRLTKQLMDDGLTAIAIHGNKSQGARTKALSSFKQGKLQVLVATDVAARGIDIHNLPHVVNFDVPQVPEDYVHRIGRTGRAGRKGKATTFIGAEDVSMLRSIERHLKVSIPQLVVPGFEPDMALTKKLSDPSPILGRVGAREPSRLRKQSRRRGSRGYYGNNRRSPGMRDRA